MRELDIAKNALGEEHYKGICSLILSVLCKCIQFEKSEAESQYFVVYMTRRCSVIWENMWISIEEDDDELARKIQMTIRALGKIEHGTIADNYSAFSKKHCVTGVALRSMTGSIVESYFNGNEIPHIIVIDDLLFHGRSINGFLYGMEESLRSQFSNFLTSHPERSMEDASQICRAFLDALFLEIYAVNRNDKLLVSRYAERLSFCRQCTRVELHDLSMRLAQYAATTGCNSEFSWSLQYTDHQANLLDRINGSNGVFRSVKTTLQGKEQYNLVSLYPNESSPKLACTIRFKNTCNGVSCVPLILYDHLKWENVYALHERLCEDAANRGDCDVVAFLRQNDQYIESDMEENKKYYVRWISETNDLVLTCMLMCQFARNVAGDSNWDSHSARYAVKVDYSHLLPNYHLHFHTDEEDIADKAMRKIWDWNADLEEYFDLLLKGSDPFWQGKFLPDLFQTDSSCRSLKEDDPFVFAVEDAITQIGVDTENNAYIRYSGNVILSDREQISWGENYSLSATLHLFQEHLRCYADDLDGVPALCQVLAVLTHASDLGMIKMNTVLSPPPFTDGGKLEVYTRLCAGSDSLSILPLRYQEFLPLIKKITEQYSEYPRILNAEIDDIVDQLLPKRLFSPEDWKKRPHRSSTIMKDRLKFFVGGLMQAGQTAQEWELALNSHI